MSPGTLNPDGLTEASQVEFRRRMKYWLAGFAFLLVTAGLFVGYVVDEQHNDAEDRVAARYILCLELEKLKTAQRVSLQERLNDNEDFLFANPNGLPSIGIGRAQIQRAINRDERLLKSLAPYADGCVSFARDPANLQVHVPPLEK